MDRRYSRETVARHNKEGDAWMILNGLVFDLTRLLRRYPERREKLGQFAGKDAGDACAVEEDFQLFQIGIVEDEEPEKEDAGNSWDKGELLCLFVIVGGTAVIAVCTYRTRCCYK